MDLPESLAGSSRPLCQPLQGTELEAKFAPSPCSLAIPGCWQLRVSARPGAESAGPERELQGNSSISHSEKEQGRLGRARFAEQAAIRLWLLPYKLAQE